MTMLKGINPRLNADVLRVLRAMGHGDALVIADANFPSDSVARRTVTGKLLRMDNLTAGEVAPRARRVVQTHQRRSSPAASQRNGTRCYVVIHRSIPLG
jgi:L-fucose mutarotase/ribose pyranase (RbsD/FucU family)